jgi:muconate cycloisomerase
MALVRLRDDEGVVGLGEAVPLSLRGGARLEQVVNELRASSGESNERMTAPARAALEMAHLDLRGRRDDVPAWRLLGGDAPGPVACNATLTADEPTAVARQAEDWAGLGFRSFKLKAGKPGDVAAVGEVRAVVGHEARIRIDANGVWTVDQATLELGAMEQHRLELAEEPVSGLQELALLRARTAISLAADESVSSPPQAQRARELGAGSLATVKLAKVGGFAAASAIAGVLPVYMSSALDGPVGIAAAGHFALALGDRSAGIAHGVATQLLFGETTAAVGPEVRDGHLHLPEGPGLGVELDEEALERLRIDG